MTNFLHKYRNNKRGTSTINMDYYGNYFYSRDDMEPDEIIYLMFNEEKVSVYITNEITYFTDGAFKYLEYFLDNEDGLYLKFKKDN